MEEFVTVTVNVPLALTLGFAVVPPDTMPDPLQLKPVPLAVLPESTTDVAAHVSAPPVALAPGKFPLKVTEALAVLAQPFTAFVTRNVYVPETDVVGF